MKGIFDLIKDYGQDLKNTFDLRSVEYVVHCWRTIHMGVFASYFCYNKLPQTQLLKTTEVYYYVGSQKSWNQCVDRGVFLLEVLGERPFPCLFQLLEVTCISLCPLPSFSKYSILKSLPDSWPSCFHCPISSHSDSPVFLSEELVAP